MAALCDIIDILLVASPHNGVFVLTNDIMMVNDDICDVLGGVTTIVWRIDIIDQWYYWRYWKKVTPYDVLMLWYVAIILLLSGIIIIINTMTENEAQFINYCVWQYKKQQWRYMMMIVLFINEMTSVIWWWWYWYLLCGDDDMMK